jgi:hypothetical protein
MYKFDELLNHFVIKIIINGDVDVSYCVLKQI